MPLNELVEINCKEDLEHLLEKLFHENEMLQESVTMLELRLREVEATTTNIAYIPPTGYGLTSTVYGPTPGSITPMTSKELNELVDRYKEELKIK